MQRWSQPDAINSVSLCLKEIVNHIQVNKAMVPQRTVGCSQQLARSGTMGKKNTVSALLIASHMLILMRGLPSSQVCSGTG